MKAIVVTQPGDPSVLQVRERPVPELKPNEVLISVKAAGINRPDIYQRQGNYPPPPGASPDIPGLEVAGIIAGVGEAVSQWKKGDKVCALLAGGGYAEFAAVNEGQCLPVPHNFSFVQAASLPETVFTVWSNVFRSGRLKAGEHFLVHGGSSGIGITAIQLAKAFGALVYATAGSAEKCEACLSSGADICINYKEEDFEKALGEKSADVVLDMIGGDYVPKNIRLLKTGGRLVFINSMNGEIAELNIRMVMQKRLMITGSTLRNREVAFKAELAAEIREQVWPLLEDGTFKPVIYRIFPLQDAAEAHRLVETGTHIGKIVLTLE